MTIIKTRPIVFSGKSVQAIQAFFKTQTRRVVIPQPALGKHWKHGWVVDPDVVDIPVAFCPFGIRGDRLWVRETWRIAGLMYDEAPIIQYKADGVEREGYPIDHTWNEDKYLDWYQRQWEYMATDCARAGIEADAEGVYHWTKETNPNRWRSPRFMPRWASRLTLEIASVRAEWLQNITPQDCFAEGWPRHLELFPLVNTESKALRWFTRLWNALNAKREFGWDMNPLVWVITFRLPERG